MESENISYNLRGFTKTFPGITAVDNVDLDVKQGEIHGIIGKNGAGKTVLMTLITGATKVNQGTMTVFGKPVNMATYNPAEARKLGIMLIPQEPLIAPMMSVVDNLFLNAELKTLLGLIDEHCMVNTVLEIAEKVSVKVNPKSRMGDISLEGQQLLTFGKAMYIMHSKIFLLDEITASLPKERKLQLLNLLKESIKNDPQLSFTLISHHINEIIEFCDRVTVLRDGKAVTTLNIAETNAHELSKYIVGNAKKTPNGSSHHYVSDPSENREAAFEVEGLGRQGYFEDINLRLFPGQVIGIAGLDGSGKHEFLDAIIGMIKPDKGQILVNGKPVAITSPNKALGFGIAYLPKKREEQAIIHNRNVQDNTLVSIYDKICSRLFGWIDAKKADEITDNSIRYLNVKTPSRKTNIDNLSGGNRQKVVLNRIHNTMPNVFVLNEPTRGVDISTKPEILSAIRNKFTQQGGVIFTSESEEELIEVSDVVLIFYKGKIIKECLREDPDFNFAEIYKFVQGVELT